MPEPVPEKTQGVASTSIDCAIEVHRRLGPGLLESVYRVCLVHELRKRSLEVKEEVIVPIKYDEIVLASGLRLDIVVEGVLIIELKSVEVVLPVHHAQVISYLRLTGMRLGLLINFNVPLLKDGIKRFAN
jgi:GxxExxY protein